MRERARRRSCTRKQPALPQGVAAELEAEGEAGIQDQWVQLQIGLDWSRAEISGGAGTQPAFLHVQEQAVLSVDEIMGAGLDQRSDIVIDFNVRQRRILGAEDRKSTR